MVARRIAPVSWDRAKQIFLETLKTTGTANAAALAAGHSLKRLKQQREDDEEFADLWDEAARNAFADLEHAARTRAVHGVKKYVISKGSLVHNPEYIPDVHPKSEQFLTERVYSDGLLTFLMEAQDPDSKYGRRHNVAISTTLQDIADERDDMKPDEIGPPSPVV